MLSDFDAQFFWPAVKTMVVNAGIEPISQGEPEDEVWRMGCRLPVHATGWIRQAVTRRPDIN